VSPGPEDRDGTVEVVERTRPGLRNRAAFALRRVVEVRDQEVGPLLWAGLHVFGLLAANYLVRPVRDEMGVAGGVDRLPLLFAGTFATMLALGTWLPGRVGRSAGGPGLTRLYRLAQLGLLGFFAVFGLVPASALPIAASAFFVAASVANLLVVSVAWSSIADRFTFDQARRLFALIAAGGTLGAIAGSAVAAALASAAGPAWLLLPAGGALELARLGSRRLLDAGGKSGVIADHGPAVVGAGPGRLFRSPYLVGLALYTLLFTASSAFVYLEQARIVESAIGDPAARAAFFARIDLLTNLLGLAAQVVLTGRLVAATGVGVAAALLPTVTLLGALAVASWPSTSTILWFQVLRRGSDYAVARPCREVLYAAVGREARYRAKGLVDTVVYRAGDVAGAWAFGLIEALPGLSRAAPMALVPLSLAWIALSLGLGHAAGARRQTPRS
jgi:AAA family ATP:ADP antiporter